MTSDMFEEIVKRALEKLERIIAREGDAEGERLQPWYLEQLIQEEIELVMISAGVGIT